MKEFPPIKIGNYEISLFHSNNSDTGKPEDILFIQDAREWQRHEMIAIVITDEELSMLASTLDKAIE